MVRTWTEDDPKARLMTRKRAQIVDAALSAFLAHGYSESSVNRIADAAGVSIKTLYRHFETKEELFGAVIVGACATPAEAESATPSWLDQPPVDGLVRAGVDYLIHALSPEQLAIYRLVVAETHRFPAIGDAYRREVLARRARPLLAYLDRWRGPMGWGLTDPLSAVAAFGALLRAPLFDDALQGRGAPSQETIAASARTAAVGLVAMIEAGLFGSRPGKITDGG